MKFTATSTALFSALVAGVSAQNSTTNSTTPISTALIPSNISTTCSTFLTSLNTDSTFTTCMSPLASLTALYSPLNSTETTSSDITATLASLCSASSGCSDKLIRSYLTSFFGACSAELTGSGYNTQVREIYDFLYVVNPFKGAVCAKDSGTARYCVLQIASNAAATSNTTEVANSTAPAEASASSVANSTLAKVNSFAVSVASDILSPAIALAASNLVVITSSTTNAVKRYLAGRADQTTFTSTIITPNTTTYLTTGIAYLFLQPNMTSSTLCTTCTKSVLASYVAWESAFPYALGLASSPILGAQGKLWSSVESTCGEAFTTAITASAGVLSANGTTTATSGANEVVGWNGVLVSLMAVGMGVVGLNVL